MIIIQFQRTWINLMCVTRVTFQCTTWVNHFKSINQFKVRNFRTTRPHINQRTPRLASALRMSLKARSRDTLLPWISSHRRTAISNKPRRVLYFNKRGFNHPWDSQTWFNKLTLWIGGSHKVYKMTKKSVKTPHLALIGLNFQYHNSCLADMMLSLQLSVTWDIKKTRMKTTSLLMSLISKPSI